MTKKVLRKLLIFHTIVKIFIRVYTFQSYDGKRFLRKVLIFHTIVKIFIRVCTFQSYDGKKISKEASNLLIFPYQWPKYLLEFALFRVIMAKKF